MTDFIDELKTSDQLYVQRRQIEERLRMQNDRIIRAKAPAAWEAVLQSLRNFSTRLRESFPNERSRQCELIRQGGDWELQGCKLPWRVLNMRLDVEGHQIDIVESTREARDRTVRNGNDRVSISVADNEEMEFHYRGRKHKTSESLAEYLISHVCDLPMRYRG